MKTGKRHSCTHAKGWINNQSLITGFRIISDKSDTIYTGGTPSNSGLDLLNLNDYFPKPSFLVTFCQKVGVGG
ncbi:MAG: hypothetical protein EWV67_13580 [Microcystis sp. M_QC_C_20170808_M2Col]|nr:MAG: hypothetical protein EWV67_13580 [Microcystis sp. M_QC_C_20170808_M2Col]TRT63424.1 MAG: hypothetical protein EWV68_22145 [Microcystis sp. M_QC_C_20170808_M9Col]